MVQAKVDLDSDVKIGTGVGEDVSVERHRYRGWLREEQNVCAQILPLGSYLLTSEKIPAVPRVGLQNSDVGRTDWKVRASTSGMALWF